jgi:hypothetical protein
MKCKTPDEQQPGRLAEVDQPGGGVGEDLLGVAQAGVGDRGVLVLASMGLLCAMANGRTSA